MPSNIRSDNGPEFISHLMEEWCEDNKVSRHYIQPGKPMQNAYVERKNGSMRRALLDAYAFDTPGKRAAWLQYTRGTTTMSGRIKHWVAYRPFFTHRNTPKSQIANLKPMKALPPYPQIRVGWRRQSKPAEKRGIVDKIFNELIMKLLRED